MQARSGKILVVDDDMMTRKMLARSLERDGHEVALADGGEQAVQMLRVEAFDAVLLDLLMPGMDGSQVLQAIKADSGLKHIPVIMISAQDELESVVKSIEMGAEDYLPKPFSPVLLRARLNASLEKKRLRDLELAYLQKQMMLRESEKLATLGRLSAGMAHELNNPASAAQRAADQLGAATVELQEAYTRVAGLDLTPEQWELLLQQARLSGERAEQALDQESLQRYEREIELEAWLVAQRVENAWEVAPVLTRYGCGVKELAALSARFPTGHFPAIAAWLSCTYTMYGLIGEIGLSTCRISEIVRAVKAYSYMDRAPIQSVDVNADLDNTITILNSKVAPGITVRREYDWSLPMIQAYGGELNQVWTNLIDNALYALNGHGEIILRTRWEDPWVVVEVQDNGPGIPKELQAVVFDPFFTTKPPGQGAGLGLTISYNIVVHKHGGQITLDSSPGYTCFQVRLPIRLESGETPGH